VPIFVQTEPVLEPLRLVHSKVDDLNYVHLVLQVVLVVDGTPEARIKDRYLNASALSH
jgi:hypothetical protein